MERIAVNRESWGGWQWRVFVDGELAACSHVGYDTAEKARAGAQAWIDWSKAETGN